VTQRPIDYGRLAAELLRNARAWVAEWLPAGVERAGRWYVGDFDGSKGESANVNLITGQWIDNAAPDQDVGRDLTSLYARIHGLSNHDAARALMERLGWWEDRPQTDSTSPAGPADTPAPAPAPANPQAQAQAGQGVPPAPPPAKGRKSNWQPIVPVPAHAPPATFVHGYRDSKQGDRWVEQTPVRTWEYAFEGELYGHVARFERMSSDGQLQKDTLPRTWCQDTEDRRGLQSWRWKAWDEPRPLYVPATLLSADLSLPVVLVEGEKCAQAGHELLGHEYDWVSWPGGCKTWALARWGWLKGRTVYLWPDADAQRERLNKAEREAGLDPATKPLLPAHRQPGMQAMVHIGALLMAEHGCTVYMCQIPPPGKMPDGWDVADAIAAGWGPEQVRDMIRGAVPFTPPHDEDKPRHAAKTAPTPSTAGASEDDATGWRRYLIEGANGAIKPVRENVALALDGYTLPDGRRVPGAPDLAGLLAWNDFANQVIKLQAPPWGGAAGHWLEHDELELGDWLTRRHGLPSMSRQTLVEAVQMVARRHSYHPVRQKLAGWRGTWDGCRRLDSWLMRCCRKAGRALPGEDDAAHAARLAQLARADDLGRYLARVGTWVVMAICARVMSPGCKFDYMLVLESPQQGLFKSTLAERLSLGWFADTGLVLGDKDSYQNLQGVLVYEWGELDSLSKAEVTKVKQFISSREDRFRAPFDARPAGYPRQVVFIGTTNELHYLTDPSGNRRFWPVRVERQIDLPWLDANLAQLFAEALHHLDAGNRFHPTLEEQRRLFDPQQGERSVDNALEGAIRRYLYDEQQRVQLGSENGALVNEISLADLLTRLGISVDKQTPALSKQASAALGRLGWERARASGKGGAARPWVYRRPKGEPLDDDGQPMPSGSDGSGGNAPAQAHADEDADAIPF